MDQTGQIKIKRGEVIGIGKVKIPKSQGFDHEIQMLSFLVIQESSNSFISTCIHLRIDGYGKTADEAKQDMVENTYYFLCENFKNLTVEDAWDNLRNLFKTDDWSNELSQIFQILESMLHIVCLKKDIHYI
jgi:transcriptional accessory protein Tex/SPT6